MSTAGDEWQLGRASSQKYDEVPRPVVGNRQPLRLLRYPLKAVKAYVSDAS